MRKITTIEKDCFYMWIEKTPPKQHNKVKDIIIGDSIGGIIKSTGMAKFKKFFDKDLKKERSVAYRYEKRFKKEKNTKWFIISQTELTKNRVQGCKEFHVIDILDHKLFETQKGTRPLRKKHYYYIVNF
jgi:hypothetical protein